MAEKDGRPLESRVGYAGKVAKSYKFMEHYIKLAVRMNAVPFHYDPKTLRLSLDRSSKKYGIWFVLMFLGMFLELAQVTQELLRALGDDSVSRGEWALILFIFLSWWLISIFHYNELKHGEEMVAYHNQVLGVRRCFKEEELPPTSDHKLVRAHIISSMCQSFFQCLMVAAEGWRNQYIYSLIPEEHRSALTMMVWVPYAYYRVVSNFMSGYFTLFQGMFHVQTCNQILQYRILKRMSNLENLKTYRMLQVLCRQFNKAYSNVAIPQLTIFTAGNIILGFFGTLRFVGTMEPNLYMNFPLMVTMMLLLTFTFFPSNATVKEVSQREQKRMLANAVNAQLALLPIRNLAFKEARKGPQTTSTISIPSSQPPTPGIIRRQIIAPTRSPAQVYSLKEAVLIARSFPFVAVRMGTFYAIKRSTVLTLFSFICCNTISALLTWK